MSSLHQDHLLVEGSEPVPGPRATVAKARATSRRPAEEKASSTVPAQRQGKSQRAETTPTTAGSATASTTRTARATSVPSTSGVPVTGTLAARAKAAAATKASSARAATVKAAGAKAATAKAATVKVATTARAVAAAKVSGRTTGKHRAPTAATVTPKPATVARTTAVAKPAAVAKVTTVAKPAAAAKATTVAKPAAAAKATTVAKPAAAAKAAPDVRPTPYKRTPAAAEPVAPAPVDAEATEALAGELVAAVAEGGHSTLDENRSPSIRRRPSLYLAAALVSALCVSGFTSGDPAAQATDTMSHSVSVAEELGISAAPSTAITDAHAAERLGELAVSRNERGAEQAAAAQAQAAADQAATDAAAAAAAAAAEAARPKAVLPVDGARLTSTFGQRWGTLHAGIDLAAPMRTPEMAAMDGVVLEAGPASGFGLAVYIQHENGDVTVYGHMDQILVQAGQVVKAGDVIALLGNRGQATGPHLHFEVHVGGVNGQKIDPLPWLRERGVAI